MARSTLRTVAVVYGVAAVPVVIAAVLTLTTGVKAHELRVDPTETLQAPWHLGFVGKFAATVWLCGGVIALFRGAVASGDERRFWVEVGGFTTFLALDDLLLLHDGALLEIGVPETASFAVYGLVGLYLAYVHRSRLLACRELPLLLSAAVLFACSVIIDIPGIQARGVGFVEDLLKFLGIGGWSAGLVLLAYRQLRGDQRAVEEALRSGSKWPSDGDSDTRSTPANRDRPAPGHRVTKP